MNPHEYLSSKISLQNAILEFIDNETNVEEHFQNIIQLINNQNILIDVNEFRSFLHLIDVISRHHNRSSNFFSKIEKILLILKDCFQKFLTNDEIFQIFKYNKRIILFLLQNNTIRLKKQFVKIFQYYNYKKFPHYFCNLISNKISINQLTKIKNECGDDDCESEDFQNNQIIGENPQKICQLIRNDSIEEFITYVERSELALDTVIEPSIFETNYFLENKNASLIEYASFFGSIQIFKYLYKNGVELRSSLWLFAIHGRNPEIFSILDEKNIKPEDETYNKCLKEAIRCHHNEIVEYICLNYIKTKDYKKFYIRALKNYNYQCFKEKIIDFDFFIQYCYYDYYYFVNYYLTNVNFDINSIYKVNRKRLTMIATALNISIKFNNTTISEILLQVPNIDINYKYTSINNTDKEYVFNNLYFAFENCNYKIFKLLLENPQINVNLKYHKKIFDIDGYQFIEFHMLKDLINSTKMKMLNMLLSHPQIDVNLETKHYYNYEQIFYKKTPLYIAIYKQYTDIVKLLLSHPNINVNLAAKVTDYGVFPLIVAIENGNIEIVSLLLSHPDIKLDFFHTFKNESYTFKMNPLNFAVYTMQKDIIKILYNSGKFDVNKKGLITNSNKSKEISALSSAVYLKDYEIIQCLLSFPTIDVNDYMILKNYDDIDEQRIPLLCQFYIENYGNNENIMKLFLENSKIDVNCIYKRVSKKENTSYSLLNLALKENDHNTINLLLNHKNINVNMKSIEETHEKDTFTKKVAPILHFAIKNSDIDCIKQLLNHPQIDINIIAVTETNKRKVKIKKEETILETAIYNRNIPIIDMLLSHERIEINLKSKRMVASFQNFFIEENDALELAIKLDNLEIIQKLCTYLNDKIKFTTERLNQLMNLTSNDEVKSLLYSIFK